MLETHVSPAPLEAPAAAPVCAECGSIATPRGTCLEIGACAAADRAATRGAAGATAKYAPAPAAWNARGGVD